MEKRKVTVFIAGQPCTFYTDDSDEYLSLLSKRVNAAMRETSGFSGDSSYNNAVLSAVSLADELLRTEQRMRLSSEMQKPGEKKAGEKKPGGEKGSAARKRSAREDGKVRGQISVWDMLEKKDGQA